MTEEKKIVLVKLLLRRRVLFFMPWLLFGSQKRYPRCLVLLYHFPHYTVMCAKGRRNSARRRRRGYLTVLGGGLDLAGALVAFGGDTGDGVGFLALWVNDVLAKETWGRIYKILEGW